MFAVDSLLISEPHVKHTRQIYLGQGGGEAALDLVLPDLDGLLDELESAVSAREEPRPAPPQPVALRPRRGRIFGSSALAFVPPD